MSSGESSSTKRKVVNNGGASGIWCLGFLGALVYYLHTHSGTFWLVVLAFLKALVWPAFVVYHVLQLPT
jgi:hypothetical protein